MTIGEIRMEIPSVDCDYGGRNNGELGKPKKCRVIYIHPEDRFYRVEFTTSGGAHIRESYIITERCPSRTPKRTNRM
jgi:hypothetical protein